MVIDSAIWLFINEAKQHVNMYMIHNYNIATIIVKSTNISAYTATTSPCPQITHLQGYLRHPNLH